MAAHRQIAVRGRGGEAQHGRAGFAFSLVELLVVVAILALLISLLVPSLTAARDNVKSLRCRTNLRQWSVGTILYAQENAGFLPRRGQGVQTTTNIDRPTDWFNALPRSLGLEAYSDMVRNGRMPRPRQESIWICPNVAEAAGPYWFAYGMNMRLSTWQAEQPDRIDAVAPPDRQVFMADGPGAYCAILPTNKAYSATARHRGSVNIGFLDAHVAGFAGEYVGCGKGDPLRDDVRWVVPNSTWSGPGE